MKIIVGSVLILVSLLMLSCNKPVYKHNPDFEGTWQTIPVYDSLLNYLSTSEIVIDGEEGLFRNSCKTCPDDLCDCLNVQTGKAVMNDKKTQMRIGTNGTALIINEEPNIDSNGEWTMVIQGLRYYRQ